MNHDPTGSDWTADELTIIVADYFSMLEAELAGRTFSKTQHRRALLSLVRRTEGSIEFKHQNISAVLQELGLPWIAGYKPRSNYQGALLDAVECHLDRHPLLLSPVPHPPQLSDHGIEAIFVPPPSTREGLASSPVLQRLIRKFDPAVRDARNARLGKAGEKFVFDLERRRLANLGCRDLATKMRWVAETDGDGAGYDILSFEPTGAERLLEVKTTCGSERTPFYLTRNELTLSNERRSDFKLVRVHHFANNPKIFVLEPPLSEQLRIEPIAYRAGWD